MRTITVRVDFCIEHKSVLDLPNNVTSRMVITYWTETGYRRVVWIDRVFDFENLRSTNEWKAYLIGLEDDPVEIASAVFNKGHVTTLLVEDMMRRIVDTYVDHEARKFCDAVFVDFSYVSLQELEVENG